MPLEALDDPELVVPTIGRALGLVDRGDQPLHERLRLHLHERCVLLVLDNFEHVLPGGAAGRPPGGRPHPQGAGHQPAALRLAAEHRFPVPPLTLPLPSGERGRPRGGRTGRGRGWTWTTWPAPKPCASSSPGPGRRSRASRSRQRTGSRSPPMSRGLDGLPLALELAAARIPCARPARLLGGWKAGSDS